MSEDRSMTETTVVHVLRHGEVHNPTGVLYGRLPGFHLSELGRRMADRIAEHLRGERHHPRRVLAAGAGAGDGRAHRRGARARPVATDDRLIEAGNVFEGKTFGVGDGSLRRPAHWMHLRNPFRPSWGEPYVEIAERMLAAIAAARDAARGHEALAVSHQLPIWTARSFASGRRLWHDPRKRQCSLASLTSFTYSGRRPRVGLLRGAGPRPAPRAGAGTAKKFVAGA